MAITSSVYLTSDSSKVLVDGSGSIQPVSGTVTANAGTNLNTSLLALDTSVNGVLRAQGSTTSGQSGTLIQGAVTTAAPAYTTGQTSPLSLTLSGALRVDSTGSTGTVTANQGTSPWVTNITQFGSSNVVTGIGASGAGIPRVTVANDSNILATQSGAWTTGRTWTLASGTDSVSAVQSGTWNINNISGTISLPTGAATEATLSGINGKLANNYGASTGGLRTASQIGNTTGAADFNYGTVGAQTLRIASQIGNATGAALFGAGTTTAQVIRAVLPTDQTGINSFLDKNSTGALTALNQAVTVATNGMATAIVQLLGTFVGTIVFEASVDSGANWFTVTGIYLNVNLVPIAQLNSTGQVAVYVGAATNLRARVNAYTSGTLNVTINTSNGALSNIATQAVRLADNMGAYLTSTLSTTGSRQALDVSSKSPLTASAPTFATIGVASGTVIAANANRKGLVVQNTSSLATISLNLVAGSAVLNSGITLYPHDIWYMDEWTFTTAQINAISSLASTNVSIQEMV